MEMDLRDLYNEISKIKKGMPNVFDIVMVISENKAKLTEICHQIHDLSINKSDIEILFKAINKNQINKEFFKKFIEDANNIDYTAIIMKMAIMRKKTDFAKLLFNIVKEREEEYCQFIGKIFKDKKPEIENYLWEMLEGKVQKSVGKKVVGAWTTIILIIVTLILLGIGVVATSNNLIELSDKIKEVSKKEVKE